MKKKLPNIFANKIEKPIGNNEAYAYADKREIEESEQLPEKKVDVFKELNKIFDSPHYVYKMDVEIKTKDGKKVKRLIGRNKTHIITMENEQIPISDILDIKEKK